MTASPRVLREWHNRVTAEYRSAALTAQALHLAIQCGLPDELVDTAHRIVRDELDHARLSHGCLVALGGDDTPAAIDVGALADPVDPTAPLAGLVDSIAKNFCLGETFAVPLFQAMRAGTTHPVARAVVDRVLRDEAVHRKFGWDALDALLTLDGDGIRARVQAALPAWLDGFNLAYAPGGAGAPLTDDERACGLLPLSAYDEIFHATVHEDVLPRFARRGIVP